MTKYDRLIKSGFEVFNVDDLAILWAAKNRRTVLESIKGYIKRGKIYKIYKGIYAINKDYDKCALAQKLFTPSYITYYTALAKHGIIFQHYHEIHMFSVNSKIYEIHNQKYVFHKIKLEVLYNQKGIIVENNYSIATPERALCDSLYLNHTMSFDNLRNINVKELKIMSEIYKNKRLENDVQKLITYVEEKYAE